MHHRAECKVNLGVGLQCSCKLDSSCILLPDSNMKSLQPSQNKVCCILLQAQYPDYFSAHNIYSAVENTETLCHLFPDRYSL